MSDATAPMEARVEWLTVSGHIDTWRSLGLTVTDDGMIPLVGTSIRIVPEHASGAGMVGWALSGISPATSVAHAGQHADQPAGQPAVVASAIDVDGLATDIVDSTTPVYAAHPLGASGLDHVVVLTSDLERTSEAVAAATGCDLKRIREIGTMRQGFHRIGRGGLIVELVERPDLADGPASFWGLVLIVEDLDVACELIGSNRISPPKDAVQPGRRIATISADVGLGLPVALMTR